MKKISSLKKDPEVDTLLDEFLKENPNLLDTFYDGK